MLIFNKRVYVTPRDCLCMHVLSVVISPVSEP